MHTPERAWRTRTHARRHAPAVCSVVADAGASAGAARYDLCATVNHVGSLGSGHYTATARINSAEWYLFDDAHVRRLDARTEVGSASAYLLVYQRR